MSNTTENNSSNGCISSTHIGSNNKKIGQISLLDLCNGKYKFIIPTYQRGYRWRTKHVQALINDLAFIPDNETYCLQPIVLQKNKNGDGFLVVDGQQRLTTLMLLLNAWKVDNVWEMTPENPKEKQSILNASCKENTSRVANKDKEKNDAIEIVKKLGEIFFIWYLLDDTEDGHAAFQRLNSGKIPLTSSELIRAKLMGKCANRNEMAAEWERIEQRLRDDRFWFMFNEKSSESFTRLDKLFEIITQTEEKVKLDRLAPYYVIEKDTIEKDTIEKDTIEKWWEKLLNLFWMLEQCYSDVELYHYIGWLRHFRDWQFKSIYDIYLENKINFTRELQLKIIEALNLRKDDGSVNIDGFNFGTERKTLRSFFVLFNIETLNVKVRGKKQKQRERNEYERFPFNLYANLTWDIEHIDSHTNNPMDDPAEQIEWAIETYLEKEEKNNELLDWIKSRNEPKYKEAITKIIQKIASDDDDKQNTLNKFSYDKNKQVPINYFGKLYNSLIDVACIKDKNQIGNLTLLDHHTNRSYHNAIFPRKRRIIIETDQTCTGNTFIPTCTRNVFTKYYTQIAVSITQWTQKDAESYRNAIAETFAKLIKAAEFERGNEK